MPRLLASAGGLNVMAKGCSEAEAALFTAESTAEVRFDYRAVLAQRIDLSSRYV